jgi:predicted enzyme related to lactoylglutathione lyase
MTSDKKAAIAFYSELVGWKTHDVPMGEMGDYTMIRVGERDIGGIVALDASHGVPPHFMAYCTVPNVDAGARRAEQLGGKVGVPPTDIPGVGRFAVIADPEGAHISLFKGNEEQPETEGTPPVGEFCWDELVCDAPDELLPFYKEIFGWTTKAMDMGPMGTYEVLERGDKQAGGVIKKPMPDAPTAWLTYIHVASVDESTRRAEKLRAKVLVPPMDIPNIGRFSIIADPQGAVVALYTSKQA